MSEIEAIRTAADPGTPVGLRWRATDADGNAVIQTVENAYTIAG